jgi:hypothetical protein
MADKQDTKEEIIPVGPGADEDSRGTQAPVDEGAGSDYEYPEGDSDVDGRGEDAVRDERTGHAETDEGDGQGLSREQKRRRRKREKFEQSQRELAFLRSRNEQLEREHSRRLAEMESRQSQSDVLAIDGRISQAENDIREAESLYTQALKANDAEAATEALRVRDQLRDGLNQLRGAKQHTLRSARERQSAATQPQAQDPLVTARAQEWAREHAWFNPSLQSEEAEIVQVVEQRLFREGRFDPRTREYWDEMDRRLAKRLPERYSNRREEDDDDDDFDDPPPRRYNGNGNGNGSRKPSGPVIKVGGRERTLKKGEVYIDEDRKAAMIEHGVWDDPVQREKYLKAYQKYDREASRRPR